MDRNKIAAFSGMSFKITHIFLPLFRRNIPSALQVWLYFISFQKL